MYMYTRIHIHIHIHIHCVYAQYTHMCAAGPFCNHGFYPHKPWLARLRIHEQRGLLRVYRANHLICIRFLIYD